MINFLWMIKKSKKRKKLEGYMYLLKMPLYEFSFKKVDDLNKKIENKKNELVQFTNTTVEDIWRKELDRLLIALDTL